MGEEWKAVPGFDGSCEGLKSRAGALIVGARAEDSQADQGADWIPEGWTLPTAGRCASARSHCFRWAVPAWV